MVKGSERDKNLAIVAVCDIWKYNRENHSSIVPPKPDPIASFKDSAKVFFY
jgi:hypothetical protein